MQFTPRQKRQFVDEGYIVIRGAVPRVMVNAARHAINHDLGESGMNQDQLPNFRAVTYCPELTKAPEIYRLFNDTPIFPFCESLIGAGKVLKRHTAQIALRFPSPVYSDPAPPSGHLDGIGASNAGGTNFIRGFTALATIYLSDVPNPNSGNFTVWPGSHRAIEEHFKKVGIDVLNDGQPKIDLPNGPVQITGQAGDAIITHHQIFHTAAANHSPDIRYAAIFRVQHELRHEYLNQAYTNIWHEWEGLREVLTQPEPASGAPASMYA